MLVRSTTNLSIPFFFLFQSVLSAQIDRTILTGIVTDPQNNRIQQVEVVAVQSQTGWKRETTTNAQGTYALADLPLGEFTVQFSKEGFSAVQADHIVRRFVGETGTLNVTLAVAAKHEEASVQASLLPLDRIDVLSGPANGRSLAIFASQVPGATYAGSGYQGTIRFAGHGLNSNNMTLDGLDATTVFSQAQRRYLHLSIPLDSIAEFDVKSQTFGADVEGGTAGGQVAVVSPSGTNSLHGDMFDYFRNTVIEARTPFDGSSPNPFLMNQFGGAVAGPLIRNKLFFYANYEGLRLHLDGTQVGLVPSPAFRTKAALASPPLASILAAYPAGTSPSSKANVWNYSALGSQVDNEDSGMIRLDYLYSDKTTAFLRFNTDEAVETTPSGSLTARSQWRTNFNNGMAELLHVFTPTLISEFKFGVNQDLYHGGIVSPLPYTFSVSGLSSFAGAATADIPSKTISMVDDWSWSHGSHTLKFGVEAKRDFMNEGSSAKGTLNYSSINAFLADDVNTASYIALLPLVRQRKNDYFAYLEDVWKVAKNLTVNAGVRYNFFNALHAIGNQDLPFDFGTCGGFCSNTDSYFHPRYKDIDPRLGLAWSHRNTVFRAGAGIYHTDGQPDDLSLPVFNTVSSYSFSSAKKQFSNLSYPLTPFLTYAENGGLGAISPQDLDRNRKDDYVAAWTFALQQKLPFNLLGTLNYLGNKGTNALAATYTNLAAPSTNVVPHPAFGAVPWRGNVGNSTFEALQAGIRGTFRRTLLLSALYTYSHAINDASIGGDDSDTPQDSFCRSCDRASSGNDVRQVLNVSAVYSLPFTSRIWGNWQLSANGIAQTGLPVNITVDRSNASVPGLYSIGGSERPDYVSGVSLAPPGGSRPYDWINLDAFTVPASHTFGNLGRNAFRGPSFSQLDLGLSKFISISEKLDLRLRADMFNAFNRAQYGSPNADISSANFGIITSVVGNYNSVGRGTPRELQLSAKFLF